MNEYNKYFQNLIVDILSCEYHFDKIEANNKIEAVLNAVMECKNINQSVIDTPFIDIIDTMLSTIESNLTDNTDMDKDITTYENEYEYVPALQITDIILKQKEKEEKSNIWEGSPYKYLPTLQSNNVGMVGEQYIKSICNNQNIFCVIDGAKTKKNGSGCGDGYIKGRSVEIKTAHQDQGSSNSFQHELGEKPWHADFMCFVDIAPQHIYITIFPNFSENQYKECVKCDPYFPSRSFCWRKKSGAFKFDTSIKLNEDSILKGNTIKINYGDSFKEIGEFINRLIIF
jgi:hypothetical protein